MKPKSKFSGLSNAVQEPPATGRQRRAATAADSVPVTIHISAHSYKRARIALIEADDPRPFSKLVDDLVGEWLKRQAS